MKVKNKKIGVIGMARSGIAAANFLFERGADVSICDQKSRAELLDQVRQLHPGIQTVFETTAPAPDSTPVVLSPGVDINSPALASAKERGVEIISELELAFRFNDAPVIAVTGTNGKSATTTLIGEILQNAGKDIAVGGNIGTPFISIVKANEKQWMVLEVSSFQLEAIDTFRPRIALILNISPDHLDRHKTLDRYIALKKNIAVNQTEQDFLILNHDDPITRSLGDGKKARKFYFSAQAKIQDGAFIENGSIRTMRDGTEKTICPVESLNPAVQWQVENILAAVIAADLAGVESSIIADTVQNFSGLEHRMEWVRNINGVDFINDSKGTNVGSVQKTLGSLDRPVILIMGGQDKGSDFSSLKELFKAKVKHMVLLGEAKPKIRKVLNGSFSYTEAGTLEEAVSDAYSNAASGDIVLLSPGCASFDMFRDYVERGHQFKNFVGKL